MKLHGQVTDAHRTATLSAYLLFPILRLSPAVDGLDIKRIIFSIFSLVGSNWDKISGSLVTSTTSASNADLNAVMQAASSCGISSLILENV